MRGHGVFSFCLLLAFVHTGCCSRQLQQFGSGFGSSTAAGPSPYDGDYESSVDVCYSPLDVLSVLNSTDNLTYFQEALFNTGVADLLTDPLTGLTLLAPSDSAFLEAADALGVDVNDLVASPVVIPVLLNHIVGLPLTSDLLSNGDVLPTALGQYLNVSASNDTLEFSSLAATAEVIDGDNCNCETCTSVVDVIDAVLLPDILNITSSGPETVIIMATPSGSEQVFVVIDESALGIGSPNAAPPTAAVARSSASATPPANIASAPVTSGSIRQGATSTSMGMTYYSNTAANS